MKNIKIVGVRTAAPAQLSARGLDRVSGGFLDSLFAPGGLFGGEPTTNTGTRVSTRTDVRKDSYNSPVVNSGNDASFQGVYRNVANSTPAPSQPRRR